MLDIVPVVLCGGSGTRLWPLSRKAFPKQFVPLIDGKSLLQLTLERVAPLARGRDVLLVTSEDHRFMSAEAAKQANSGAVLLLEPVARNTAAAMALAALHLMQQGDPVLLFCPSDHHIPDAQAWRDCMQSAVPSALQDEIVTFGVVPTFPSTAYGYIQKGSQLPGLGALRVDRFFEKPSADTARRLLLQGDTLWNAGIFLVRASVLAQSVKTHAPDIYAACDAAIRSGHSEVFATGLTFVRPGSQPLLACRSQSIDYAVMEHHKQVAVVPFSGQWSDVGSWSAVADLADADDTGNRLQGRGCLAIRSSNTYVYAQSRTVVTLGVQDLLVVDTPDATLIAHREHAEAVKEVVAELEARGADEALNHRRSVRPWGWVDHIEQGKSFRINHIGLNPGASMSLQKHQHRAEHWIVVKGAAEVTRGTETVLVGENESVYVPPGAVHQLRNPGPAELELVEVQSGSYLSEDDIVRLHEAYDHKS